MRLHDHRTAGRHHERGQTLVMFVTFLMALILFLGLSMDLGFAYITRARLSKAVDSACLAGMRSYTPTTQSAAENIARNAFAANYGTSGRDVGPVTPTVTFNVGAGNNVTLDVSASTRINTFFIRVLPQWKTLLVGSTAEATKVNVVMSLVLDLSGSMFMTVAEGGSDGAPFLPGAVTSFIDNFTDNSDRAALITFGSTAVTDVPMTYKFKTAIENAVKNPKNLDKTWSEGGLQAGLSQIQSVAVSSNESVLRVLVFFTDGFANTFNEKLSCSASRINVGQTDPANHKCGPNCWDVVYKDPSNDNAITCNNPNPFNSIGGTLGSDTDTITVAPGTSETISIYNLNVWTEGQLRALAVANTIRNNNVLIYCVGLGDGPTAINQVFLEQVANVNDPSNPTYNPNQPAGDIAIAPTADDLDSVFQVIAAKIALRLTK